MKSPPLSIGQAINFAGSSFKKRYGLFTAILLTIFGAAILSMGAKTFPLGMLVSLFILKKKFVKEAA